MWDNMGNVIIDLGGTIMTVFQAFILGLTQGIAEFLPISSTAHIILIPWLFHWPDPGLTFDVAIHIGTLTAVVTYFWKDWTTLIYNGFRYGIASKEGKMFWFLVVASVPGAIAGILFEESIKTVFRSPLLIGIMLIIMGLFLFGADRFGKKADSDQDITFVQSLCVGLSQALSIIPGVSRSGVTMTSGLLSGLTREGAARFSFLLSTPIIAGAGLFGLRHLTRQEINLQFIVGVATSAVIGFLVIGLLLRWLRKSNFLPFVWYRFMVGATVITLFLVRSRG
jgi:undecaprenyl-diphosphatase